MMEGLTRKDDWLEAAMRSTAALSVQCSSQEIFIISHQTHLELLQTIGLISLNPPLLPRHTRQPPGNKQNSTILTLMGTFVGNITSEYLLRVSNVEVLFQGIQRVNTSQGKKLKFCNREINLPIQHRISYASEWLLQQKPLFHTYLLLWVSSSKTLFHKIPKCCVVLCSGLLFQKFWLSAKDKNLTDIIVRLIVMLFSANVADVFRFFIQFFLWN